MLNAAFVLALAFAISAACVFAITQLAHKYRIFDSVDERKVHTGDVPRLGGIGIIAGFIVGLLLISFLYDTSLVSNNLVTLVLGGTVVFAMGVWDDFKAWKARYKLLAQCVAAIIVLAGNFTFSRITLGPIDFVWDMGIWRYPLTFFWIIGVTNALNFIDGLDGLAGSIAALAALTYALYFARYGNAVAILVCLLLAFSIGGFLVFNLPLPKAKIFMGDGGSQFLGFVLAILPLMSDREGFATIALPYAAAVLMIPIYDTIAAVWRRTRERRSPYSPDKFHLHHKLILIGFTKRESLVIVVALQFITSIFVSCAVWIRGIFALVLLMAVYFMGILFFSVIHFRKQDILSRNSTATGEE